MKYKIIVFLVALVLLSFNGMIFNNKVNSTAGYDYKKALSYADQYNNDVCSDKFDFRDHGYGDCAHYVSCCIGNETNHPGGGLELNYRDFKVNNKSLGRYYGISGAAYPINGIEGKTRITNHVDQSFWGWQLLTYLENKNLIEQKKSINDLVAGDIIQYTISSGWCKESGISLLSQNDNLESDAVVKTKTPVYKVPDGTKLSTDNKTGIVIDGPRNKNKNNWWRIRFDNGVVNHVVLYLGKINGVHCISDHLFNGGSVHGSEYTTILDDYGYDEARFFSFKDDVRTKPGDNDKNETKYGKIRFSGSAGMILSVPYTLYRSSDGQNFSYVTASETQLFDFGTEFEANYFYKVVWGEVSGYTNCGSAVKYLKPNETIEFTCSYQEKEEKRDGPKIYFVYPSNGHTGYANSAIELQWEAYNLQYKIYIWYRHQGGDWYTIVSALDTNTRRHKWTIPSKKGKCELLIGSGYDDGKYIQLEASDSIVINIENNDKNETKYGKIKFSGSAGMILSVPYTLYRSSDGQNFSYVTASETQLFDFGTEFEANYYYKVVWGEVSGYTNCGSAVKYLKPNETIEFTCSYQEKSRQGSEFEKGEWFSIGPNCYYYDSPCGSAQYIFNYENGYCVYEKQFCNNGWWYKIWMQDDNGYYNQFCWIREYDIKKKISQPVAGISTEHYFKKNAQAYDKPCNNKIDTIKYDGNIFLITDRLYRCDYWWYKVYVAPWQRYVWFKEDAIQN